MKNDYYWRKLIQLEHCFVEYWRKLRKYYDA